MEPPIKLKPRPIYTTRLFLSYVDFQSSTPPKRPKSSTNTPAISMSPSVPDTRGWKRPDNSIKNTIKYTYLKEDSDFVVFSGNYKQYEQKSVINLGNHIPNSHQIVSTLPFPRAFDSGMCSVVCRADTYRPIHQHVWFVAAVPQALRDDFPRHPIQYSILRIYVGM